MGALARLFFNEREKKLAAATPVPPSTISMATDAAGKTFGTVEDPQQAAKKPELEPQPWQMAEHAP